MRNGLRLGLMVAFTLSIRSLDAQVPRMGHGPLMGAALSNPSCADAERRQLRGMPERGWD
jgi:hypothetical protein